MVKTALLESQIDAGAKVVDALERMGIRLAYALWAYADEYEEWRLMLISPDLDKRGDAYGEIGDAIREVDPAYKLRIAPWHVGMDNYGMPEFKRDLKKARKRDLPCEWRDWIKLQTFHINGAYLYRIP